MNKLANAIIEMISLDNSVKFQKGDNSFIITIAASGTVDSNSSKRINS